MSRLSEVVRTSDLTGMRQIYFRFDKSQVEGHPFDLQSRAHDHCHIRVNARTYPASRSRILRLKRMFYHIQNLINPIIDDEPDPSAANALQEGLGGQFGEMRTMMQFLFQSFNFRGDAKPYLDLIHGIAVEEISHVELITKTISKLLDGAPEYKGKRFDVPGKGGAAPLDMAKEQKNPHHFIVGAQGALPVDAAGNPWSGSYVHCNGNLVLDLLDNLVLESTGRLQKCRIYQMSDNKTLRATVSFLIARDEAHEMAFAKALETAE